MNQYKLEFFLKFAEHHKVKLSKLGTISRRGVGWQICKGQLCTTCVHGNGNNTGCSLSIITKDEVEFLKLQHPEYFL